MSNTAALQNMTILDGTKPIYLDKIAGNAYEITPRGDELFEEHINAIYKVTDRMFVNLMLVQWVGAMLAAFLISPQTWYGSQSQIHQHVWYATILGGLIASLPIYLGLKMPGTTMTRHTIAASQMLMSALLIDLTGGRIETHFHVFGSLAFLAFYRDWRVLLTATLVIAVHHFIGGIFFPQEVFGVVDPDKWRWVEHAAWVVFEDVFLFYSCVRAVNFVKSTAMREAELEATYAVATETAKRLAESEEQTRQIIDSTIDAVITFDSRGAITGWNPQAAWMFGIAPEDASGKDFAQTVYPEHLRGEHAKTINHYLTTRDLTRMNHRAEGIAKRGNGVEFPIEIAIAPMRGTDGWRFVAFARDISDLKMIEEERERYTNELVDAREKADKASAELERRVKERTLELAEANHSLSQEIKDRKNAESEVRTAYAATIEGWSKALELRDKETQGHSQRVTEITLLLCRRAGFTEEQLYHARHGALLHDIGKMGIPDEILLKPASLTIGERMIVEEHPQLAYDMLKGIEFLKPALAIPFSHHERWDGTGYPQKLAGEKIPVEARLFAMVDVYDALRSNRPYREGWPFEKVVDYIQNAAGSQFDPWAVEQFMAIVNSGELHEIEAKFPYDLATGFAEVALKAA